MKTTQPPFIATWILEHLTPGKRNDAIAGDLLEEFRNGRPAGWYWRQVMAAFAHGCISEISAHRLALVFAAVWILPARAFWAFAFWPAAHGAGFLFPWPYATVIGMTVLISLSLWTGLALYTWIYALIDRNLHLQTVRRGFWLGPLMFGVLSIAIRAFSHSLGITIAGLDTARLIIYFLSLMTAASGVGRATSEPKPSAPPDPYPS